MNSFGWSDCSWRNTGYLEGERRENNMKKKQQTILRNIHDSESREKRKRKKIKKMERRKPRRGTFDFSLLSFSPLFFSKAVLGFWIFVWLFSGVAYQSLTQIILVFWHSQFFHCCIVVSSVCFSSLFLLLFSSFLTCMHKRTKPPLCSPTKLLRWPEREIGQRHKRARETKGRGKKKGKKKAEKIIRRQNKKWEVKKETKP